MKSWIAQMIIPWILSFLTDLLTTENFKKYADKIFDIIEEAVVDSETKWDDAVVLPLIEQFRVMLEVPDADEG